MTFHNLLAISWVDHNIAVKIVPRVEHCGTL